MHEEDIELEEEVSLSLTSSPSPPLITVLDEPSSRWCSPSAMFVKFASFFSSLSISIVRAILIYSLRRRLLSSPFFCLQQKIKINLRKALEIVLLLKSCNSIVERLFNILSLWRISLKLMELSSGSLKPQSFLSKISYLSPSFLAYNDSSLQVFQSSPTLLSKQQFRFRQRRVRSVFDAKVNGALSTDSDPRYLDRQKALEAAMNDINNSFGKGSVTRLGSAGGALVETFPSGCLTLDLALGGGLPKGRIVEIYGPESSGKTTLALHAIAEVQRLGGNAMLVDAEHAFDPAYSKALGVDVENLIVCQPDNGEMALEIADRMCRSGAVDLICIDSVSALTPRAEIEGEIGMQQMGLQARLMSQALRKMSGNASKASCTLIFLNQIRHKIGVYYGNPEVTSGGIALKFFASVRLEIRPIGKIKSGKGDEDIGLKVRVRVQKSKVSRPYKQAEFEIIFGEGVSKLGCVLDCAEIMDVVLKKGSWYSYGDHRLGQGRDKALQYLRENPLLSEEIEKMVRSTMMDGMGLVTSSFMKYSSPLHEDEDILQELQ